MIRIFLWSAFVVGAIHGPAFAQPDDDDVKKYLADLAQLEKDEADLVQKVQTAASAGAKHVETKKNLDLKDEAAVKKYNTTRLELAVKLQAAIKDLEKHRTLQIPLDDRIRLAHLLKRKAHLDKEIRTHEERVKKVQDFMKKLRDESAKDSKELEAMIAMSEHASETAYKQGFNVLMQIPSVWKDVSPLLPKFDLRHYAGDDPLHITFRGTIKALRKVDDFLGTQKAKTLFAGIGFGKNFFDKDERLIPDKLIEVGQLGQTLSRDLKPHLEDLTPIRDVLASERSIALKMKLGLPSVRVLGQACEVLAVGTIAIESVGAAYEQHIACRELRKVGRIDAVTHLNAIIKTYQKDGAHFKAYKHDLDQLKSLRQERTRVEAEIQSIRARLGKG